MSAPSPAGTPAPWDLVASAYDAEVAPTFVHFAREALRLASPAPGSRLADVACGPGTLALHAAREGFAVDAVDFSPEMIDRLERRRRAENMERVHAQLGDGQALPLADAAYAGAFSLFGLMFFPDRARGFSELRRILVPGARAVVSSWQPIDRSPAMAALFRAVQEAVPPAPGASPPPPLALGTPEACRAEMGPAFADVEVHPVSTSVEFPSVDALWESMQRTLVPVVLMRRELGAQAWRPLAEKVCVLAARALGAGPVSLDLNAWLTVGTAR
ncbi:MAG TPA: class I SAM-dependent methyltransferase [Myxococcaceae bacterium]|nr:class I SAM-dependent methyltransferase [Myxococcaceae bacterium]